MTGYRKHLAYLTVFTSILGALLFIIQKINPQFFITANYFILLFFLMFNLLSGYVLVRANNKSPQVFIRSFMATSTIRMLLSLMLIIAYVLINKAAAFVFAIYFLAIYFLYLAFDVVVFMKMKQ